MRRHVYTVPTMSTVYVERSCRESMSRVHVCRSCREFMLRVYAERLCSDFTRHVMFRFHSSYDVLRHWAGSDGMFFADALSESCIFNETTTKVPSTLRHSARFRSNVPWLSPWAPLERYQSGSIAVARTCCCDPTP